MKSVSAKVRRAAIETLERRQMMSVTAPSEYALVQSGTVSATTIVPTVFSNLKADTDYYLVSKGVAIIGPTSDGRPRYTDAAFFDDLNESEGWHRLGLLTRTGGRYAFTGLVDPIDGNLLWDVTGTVPEVDHEYGQVVHTTGTEFTAYFADTDYPPNKGFLTLDVYQKVNLQSLTATHAVLNGQPETATDSDGVADSLKVTPDAQGNAIVALSGVTDPAGNGGKVVWAAYDATNTLVDSGNFAGSESIALSFLKTTDLYTVKAAVDTGNGVFDSSDLTIKSIEIKAGNLAPVVSAGPDRNISLNLKASLDGTVTDDGLPSNKLTYLWQKVSGPGTVNFDNPAAVDTAAGFSTVGTYTLKLTSSDGQLSNADQMTVIVTAPITTKFTPVGDTYVHAEFPTQNFGSNVRLLAKQSATATMRRESLIKFNLSSLSTSVGTVKLRLFTQLSNNELSTLATDIFATNSSWQELTANWSNRPASTGLKLGTANVTSLTGAWVEVDVTDYVKAAGKNPVSFLLRNPNNSGPYNIIASREAGANAPQLVVVAAPPAVNQKPVVTAGPDRTITIGKKATLDGNVTDDGLPSGALTHLWQKMSGPGTVTFDSTTAVDTAASFSTVGTYVLRLTSNDGALSSFDEMTVNVTAQPVTSTFTPIGDSYVHAEFPTQNFGSNLRLLAKQSGTATMRRESLVKFDVSAFSGTVGTVKLRLFSQLSSNELSSLATDIFKTGSTWSESTVTWTGRPASDGLKIATATVTSLTGAWVEVDVTDYIKAEKASNRNTISFLLRNPTNSGTYNIFASRESGANAPQLVVTAV